MKTRYKLFVFVIFCILTITPAYAADSSDLSAGGIGIINPKIIFHADTDEGKSQNVTLFNNSAQPITVSAQLTDFRTNENNAYVIEPPNATQNSAANCLDFENKEFTLKPNESIDVAVTLLPNCDYYLPELQSTILFKYIPVDPANQTTNSNSSVTTYYQIMAFVWVEAESNFIGNIDTSKPPMSLVALNLKKIIGSKDLQDISITLKNAGVLTVNPLFTSDIRSNLTNETIELPIDMTFLLPNSEKSSALSYSPKQLIDFCTYTLSYHYTYNGKDFSDSTSKNFIVVSYPVLCGAAVIFFGLALQIVLFFKHKKQKRNQKADIKQSLHGGDMCLY